MSGEFYSARRKKQEKIVCPVCGAVLVLEKDNSSWLARRPDDLTPEEIRARIENFARLRNYKFNELKEPLVEGLLKNMNAMRFLLSVQNR